MRITANAFPIEWAVLRAWARAKDKLEGLEFVKSVRAVPGDPPGADPRRRSDGWHTVLAVWVEAWFRTADLAKP